MFFIFLILRADFAVIDPDLDSFKLDQIRIRNSGFLMAKPIHTSSVADP